MTSTPEPFSDALSRLQRALDAIFNGDPEPYINLWSQTAEITLFGAWGPCKNGQAELTPTFHWVASRFGGGRMRYEHEVARAVGDLAYTVGYERGETVVDGAGFQPMTLRVTHILQREDGEWRLIHRHADFAPVDQSQQRGA
jgi:ketosteroid isomerase-like protein